MGKTTTKQNKNSKEIISKWTIDPTGSLLKIYTGDSIGIATGATVAGYLTLHFSLSDVLVENMH